VVAVVAVVTWRRRGGADDCHVLFLVVVVRSCVRGLDESFSTVVIR
jgi:hypothetical protein